MHSGKEVRLRPSFGRHLLAAWPYIPVNVALCAVLAGIASWQFGFSYSSAAIVFTGAALGLFAVALSPSLRSWRWGAAVCFILALLLLIGNPIKISMLRLPISLADAQALPVLFKTMGGKHLALGIAMSVTLLLVLLGSLRYQWRALLSLTLAAGLIALLPIVARAPLLARVMPLPVAERTMFGGETAKMDHVDDPIAFLKTRGPLLFLAADWNYLYRDSDGPSRAEVDALGIEPWLPLHPKPTRNVHVVLLESLWDVGALAHHHTDIEPFDPRFTALWNAAGRTHALSPVFGGSTANAEFEVLCGFPAPRNSVAFVNNLRRSSPCLPTALAASGYESVASHAHEATNWNRQRAYKAIGFDKYKPLGAFDLDDMDGTYLADSSFLRQNVDFLQQRSGTRPIFNYQVSLASHWAYARNRKTRPDLVTVQPDNVELLNDYVNAVAYTTRAFMDWTEQILSADPDALIVAFGDHAPVLVRNGVDDDVYRDVNLADPAHFDDEVTRSMLGMARTPLLVIDGERGPLALPNDVPLYDIPHVISGILGKGELLPQSAQRGDLIVRPFIGHLLTGANGAWQNCAENAALSNTPICIEARKQFNRLRTLRRDSIRGENHFLRAVDGEDMIVSRTAEMELEQTWEPCIFEVDQWGPQQGTAGRGFNVQSNGHSTVWVTTKALRGEPVVRLAGMAGRSVYGSRVITTEFGDRKLYDGPRALPLTIQCEGKPETLIGQIIIR